MGEKNGELKRWANMIGSGVKMTDAMICMHCHQKNWPQHNGHADYIIDWRRDNGLPYSLRIESKSTNNQDPMHFSFLEYKPHQRIWMDRWIDTTGSRDAGWIWLQMGNAALNAIVVQDGAKLPDPARRQVYLVAYDAFLDMERRVMSVGGIKNLPKNELAAQTRVAVRDNSLYAEALLSKWAMEWKGSNDWWTPQEHPIWSITGTEYYDYAIGAAFRAQHQQPD